jgi:hypothetical protein
LPPLLLSALFASLLALCPETMRKLRDKYSARALRRRWRRGLSRLGDFADAMLISVRIAPRSLLLFQNRNLCEKEPSSFLPCWRP